MPKQLLIISGKGGTGKTTITAALAAMAKNTVIADCDVDAANLYILLQPDNSKEMSFGGGKVAVLDTKKCSLCGLCEEYCRYDAISIHRKKVQISETACEGCGLCTRVCPEKAIQLLQSFKSKWFKGSTRFGPMVHARLGIGEDNSGKLVTEIRQEAFHTAKANKINTVIIDGPPGIGCPVIASLTGTDMVLIVAEPTKSGIHDLKRTITLTESFSIKTAILINKSDINIGLSEEIEHYCNEKKIKLIGKLPFDKIFVESMLQRMTLPEFFSENDENKNYKNLNIELNSIWEQIKLMLPL